MWSAELKTILLTRHFRGTFADAKNVLLIGVSSNEIERIQTDLHEDLRSKQIYLLDPRNEYSATFESNVHIVKGKIGDHDFDIIVPGMFDIIIVDFAVLKFIKIIDLAVFTNVFLEPNGHIFVRDLSLPTDIEELPSVYKRTDKQVTLEYPNGYSELLSLQPQWTTQHYKYYLGLSDSFTLTVFLKKLEDDKIWYDSIPNESNVHMIPQMSARDYNTFKEIFKAHTLKCNQATAYPLLNKHEPGRKQGMLECTFDVSKT
tara:strand:+ start:232 stop:1008 length:777 start_codon:yes stop_codon:yes gene_type:complete